MSSLTSLQNTMGYLHDVEKTLQAMLTDLKEGQQKSVMKFVKERILESYHNGITAAGMAAAGGKTEQKPRKFASGR